MTEGKLYNCNLQYHIIKTCTEKWGLRKQKIDFYQLLFVQTGCAHFYLNDTLYVLEQGDAIFLPVNSTRKAHIIGNNGLSIVDFNFTLPLDESLQLPTHFSWKGNMKLPQYFNEFNKEWCLKSPNYMLKCSALLNLVFYEITKDKLEVHQNHYIVQIKEYISDHVDQKVTVDEIANFLNINSIYCGSLFKTITGTTIIHYIHQVKIDKAKLLLAEKDLTIYQVGSLIGIDDPYYFSKTFKSIVGVSPKEYRAKI